MSKKFDPLGMFHENPEPEPKPGDKKPEDKKPEDKKPEDKKPEDKKTKDESFAELKAARDKALADKKQLEEELKELRAIKPLKKVADYLKLKSKKDEIEDGDVDSFIETNKDRKKKLSELDEKVKLKDQAIKELSIENSDEWQEDYVKPIKKSATNIFTIISNVDEKGEVREKDLTDSLIREIVSLDAEGNPKTPVEVKGIFARFKKKYEEKTGLDYDPPKLSEVIESIETYHSKILSATKARQNWDKEVEEKKKSAIFQQSKEEEAFIKKEVSSRDYVFNKLKESNDFVGIKEVIDEEELNTFAKEEHSFLQSGLMKEKDYKPRGYDSLILSLTKGKAFDSLSAKYKELQKENESLKSKLKGGLPPHRGDKIERQDKKEEVSLKDVGDPTDFLRRQ